MANKIFDLYSILKSKPHNSHYLQKYWNFIDNCDKKNKNDQSINYIEVHHIAPAAKDLFPEYSNLKDCVWNAVKLTARQHILAHIMLWKVYGGSQIIALDCMLNRFNSYSNYKLQERYIPESIKIRYLAKLREDTRKRTSEFRLGKAI